MEGYLDGTWINGSHWYYDPFDIYSDYKVDHILEILGELNSDYNPPSLSVMAGIYEQESMYFLYNILDKSDQDHKPVPVPEPNSVFLLLAGLVFLCLANHFFLKRPR